MIVHRGESVAPGIAVGPVHLRGWNEEALLGQRIAADQVEDELNRLREALQKSRAQVEDIRQQEKETLGEVELRIFDAHLAYLSDPMFVDEIEKQVMAERFTVREAIKLVLEKYDRIHQLVESDILRRRASDLRDVATRLLRNLADGGPRGSELQAPQGPYVLVARKLTTADMFNLENGRVEGIVAEEGGMSSHAAILARSMGIPTITGIRDLPRLLREGDVVALDAGANELRTGLDERQLAESMAAAQRWRNTREQAPDATQRHVTRDGTVVHMLSACGSLGEADLGRTFGLGGIGLYRTELLFLVDQARTDRQRPTEDELTRHYVEVLEHARGTAVNFRLLDLAADTLSPGARSPERNPAMGLRGIRGLFANQDVMRRQLRALLRAAAGHEGTGLLVPLVTGVADLQRLKSAVLEERHSLRKAGVACAASLRVAPIVEVPAAAMILGQLLEEADFAVVSIDDLVAHLLGADRDNAAVRDYHQMPHPAVFELVARMARDAEKRHKELMLFGELAADPQRAPFHVGAGIRHFAIAPVRLRAMLRVLARYSVEECRRIATRVLEAPRTLDVQRVLVGIETD